MQLTSETSYCLYSVPKEDKPLYKGQSKSTIVSTRQLRDIAGPYADVVMIMVSWFTIGEVHLLKSMQKLPGIKSLNDFVTVHHPSSQTCPL